MSLKAAILLLFNRTAQLVQHSSDKSPKSEEGFAYQPKHVFGCHFSPQKVMPAEPTSRTISLT